MTTLEHGAPGHPGHHHPGAAAGDGPLLAHHFDDLEQQHESSNLGMWLFLATEVMFFGGVIVAYAVYRSMEPSAPGQIEDNMFVQASRRLYVWAGFANTVILLTSSLTMALAVRCAQLNQPRNTVRLLLATIVLGTAFLGVKAYEWTSDYYEHLVPGIDWNWELSQAEHHKATPPHGFIDNPRPSTPDPGESVGWERVRSPESTRAEKFFCFYFFMTGLHALHMIIGVGLLGTLAWMAHTRWLSGGGGTQIEMAGLYWHFVDIVWVFLYPLLYLIDIHR